MAGDLLTVYGRDRAISKLDSRLYGASGEQSHQDAIAEQQAAIEQETSLDIATSAGSVASSSRIRSV